MSEKLISDEEIRTLSKAGEIPFHKVEFICVTAEALVRKRLAEMLRDGSTGKRDDCGEWAASIVGGD